MFLSITSTNMYLAYLHSARPCLSAGYLFLDDQQYMVLPLKRNQTHTVSQSVQLLSLVWLFVTPWTAARQASLSITNSWSLLKLMSIESVMPSNHLIFGCPLLLLPSIFPSIRVFSNESVLRIRWPEYCSFSFNISPSSEYSGLIYFRMGWLDLLAVQGTLNSLSHHLPTGSFCKLLILLHQRADRLKTTIWKLVRKLTNLITWTTALSNSMKLWAMPCRATQDEEPVIVESSEKMWSTGEGNGKPLQYSCLETHTTLLKIKFRSPWSKNMGSQKIT